MRPQCLLVFSCAAAITFGGSPQPAAAGAGPAAAKVLLVDELGEDQQSERVTVFVDDTSVGEIALDRRRARGALALALTGPLHRYRIEGEAVIDGTTYAVAGSGLIVTAGRLDEIAERPATAVEALAAYRALVDELRAVAPAEAVEGVLLTVATPVSAAAVDAAERRLGVKLPSGYRRVVTTVGPFTLGTPGLRTGAVLAPAELASAVDFYVRQMREDGWDADDTRDLEARIGRRFPQSRRDVVLDWFELDEPTVLVAGERCPAGEVAIALPGSDFDLLGVDPGDNALLGLIGYDDVMGGADCLDYDRLLAYSLHDHLVGMADGVLLVRDEDTRELTVARLGIDEEARTVWLSLAERN